MPRVDVRGCRNLYDYAKHVAGVESGMESDVGGGGGGGEVSDGRRAIAAQTRHDDSQVVKEQRFFRPFLSCRATSAI